MRGTRLYALLTIVVLVTLGAASYAVADGGKRNIRSDRLSGFQEAPPVYSTGKGSFKAQLDRNAQKITFELTYSDLSSAAVAAHLHFAQRGVSAGIVVHLCGTGGRPACPAAGTTVTGEIVPANVVALNGLDQFDELVQAIRAGRIYVNVHTTTFPSGEIRAQLNNRNRK